MIFENLWDAVQRAWAYVPLPWLLLVLILIGFVWLWIEYQTTRLARALPFWRRPVPILPQISLVFGWVIRISRGMLILWLIVFAALAINFWTADRVATYPPAVDRFLTGTGRVWHQGYAFVMDRLPEKTPEWLLPPALEEADQGS